MKTNKKEQWTNEPMHEPMSLDVKFALVILSGLLIISIVTATVLDTLNII